MAKNCDILQEFYFDRNTKLIREDLTLTYPDGLTPPIKETTTDAAFAQWVVECWQFTHGQLAGYEVSIKQVAHVL